MRLKYYLALIVSMSRVILLECKLSSSWILFTNL